jgi:hypothetical protein
MIYFLMIIFQIPTFTKCYGGDGEDISYSIIQTYDGCYVIGGHCTSFGFWGKDFLLLKTDPRGRVIWAKVYGGGGDDYLSQVIETKDKGFTLIGRSYSYGPSSGYGGDAMLFIKTDSLGNVQFSKTYGGEHHNYGARGEVILQLEDNNFIIGGVSSYYSGEDDIVMIKTDPSGNIIWSKVYGGGGRDEINSLGLLSNGF